MNKHRFEDSRGDRSQKKVPKNGSFFAEIGRFFDSIAEVLIGQAKAAEENPHPMSATRRIQPIKKRQDLIAGIESCIQHLTKLKNELLVEFGSSCSQFVSKSIDPMIQHAEELIVRLSKAENSASLEEEAIRSVGLYSEFNDEKKLRRKIINEAVHTSRDAIEKDCQVLRNYQHHAHLSHKNVTDEQLNLLEEKLEPVVQQFHSLHLTKFVSEDIRGFFIWKSQIDEQRAELLERGFQLIDFYFSTLPGVTKKADSSSDQDIANLSEELSSLTDLEQRVLNLMYILDENEGFTPDEFNEMSQRLHSLKKEAEFLKNSTDSDQHKAFQSLEEALTNTESIFREKKQEQQEK
jgi:hypothetical protein